MNVRLLREIAKVIQEKPRQFNMRFWHLDKKNKLFSWSDGIKADALCELPEDRRIACTTTHCIAGWAQVLSPDRKCKVKAEKDARRLLELTPKQAYRLFYADNWPKGFGHWKSTAKQAAARIEHFIKTAGEE